MILIGLNGRARSGKDTAYWIIEELALAAGLRCQRICFADKMKLSGIKALGFKPKSVAEAVELADLLKEYGFVKTVWKVGNVVNIKEVSGREFWQFYGTEAHREVFGEDFWVDELLPQPSHTIPGSDRYFDNQVALQRRFPNADVLVDTTTRFANEAQRILELNGHVWHIDADYRLGALPQGAHVSEFGLPKRLVTCTIPNNGSLEQFEDAVASTWSLGC